MYETLNQYHVVMEVAPEFQQSTDALENLYVRSSTGQNVPAQRLHALRAFADLAGRRAPRPVSGRDVLLQSRARTCLWETRSTAVQDAMNTMVLPGTIHGSFQGTAQAFQDSLSTRALSDPGGPGDRVHRAGNALRELHSSHHHPVHASLGGSRSVAGAAAVSHRAQHHRHDRDHPADRYREEERHPDDRFRDRTRSARKGTVRWTRSIRPACCASGRS